MKLETFKVSWNMFRTFNLIWEIDTDFIEEWSKDELRNRVYEGV